MAVRTDNGELKLNVDMEALGFCLVLNEMGQETHVKQLWQDHPSILVFLRHFACIGCRAHAKLVWDKRESYEKNGAKIAFISTGEPNFVMGFKEELGITDAPVYVDPTREIFKAAGFKRGFLAALGPSSIKKGMDLYKDGHKQAKYEKGKGDLWQLGGVLVVTQNGELQYQYVSEAVGDYPPTKDGELM